jgi:hypothetical protein
VSTRFDGAYDAKMSRQSARSEYLDDRLEAVKTHLCPKLLCPGRPVRR